jgi:hypothetical protein
VTLKDVGLLISLATNVFRIWFIARRAGAPPRSASSNGAGRSLVIGENRRQAQKERIPPRIWLWPDGDPTRAKVLAENFPLVGYRLVAGGKWGITTDTLAPDVWLWNPETGARVRSLGVPLNVAEASAVAAAHHADARGGCVMGYRFLDAQEQVAAEPNQAEASPQLFPRQSFCNRGSIGSGHPSLSTGRQPDRDVAPSGKYGCGTDLWRDK